MCCLLISIVVHANLRAGQPLFEQGVMKNTRDDMQAYQEMETSRSKIQIIIFIAIRDFDANRCTNVLQESFISSEEELIIRERTTREC